jgi:hypothetical protein
MDDQVTDLAVDGAGDLYAAGWFRRAGEVAANGIARWDGSAWSPLGNGTNSVEAIATGPDGYLYAAGMFFIPPNSDTFTHYIARWDGSAWSPLGEGVENFVHALAVDPAGNLYAAGEFASAGGIPANRIARWDGAAWSPLGSGIGTPGDDSYITALVADERGDLYVGGQFTLAGNKPSAYLAKWCAELQAGACTFSFEIAPADQEATPFVTATLTRPVATPTPTAAGLALSPSPSPTGEPAAAIREEGTDDRLWIAAAAVLVFILAGLFFYFVRRV